MELRSGKEQNHSAYLGSFLYRKRVWNAGFLEYDSGGDLCSVTRCPILEKKPWDFEKLV